MKNFNRKSLENNSIFANETYLSREDWFEVYGSIRILDYLTLYLMVPISLIGFLINWLCFFILNKQIFKAKQIFNYLKVYVINSSFICLLSATHFIAATKIFFEFTNTYEACSYGSNAYAYLLSASYFYSSYLDIYLSLERLSNFLPSFHLKIKNLSYKKLCLGLLIFSVVANIPFYFAYTPIYVDVKLNVTESFRIYLADASDFGKSLIGKLSSGIVFFLRDVFTIIVELILNCITVILLKKQFSRKKKMVIENEIDDTIDRTEGTSNNATSSGSKATHGKNSNSHTSKLNRNLTYTVLLICVFSIFAHVLTLVCTSLFLLGGNLVTNYICFVANLFVSVKHFLNFFIFILFNSLFKKEFKNIFSK